MQDIEIWKPIPSLLGFYEASSLGRIRSISRVSVLNGKHLRPIKGKIIKQTRHKKTGYFYLSVCVNGVVMSRLSHRLIAEAWIENPMNKPHVNHLKGIKSDNRPSQLEWSTISENRLHSFRIGLQTAKGSKNSQARLTLEQVLEIRNSTDKNGVIAKRYNVSPATVCDIQTKRSWSHI